VSSDDKARGHAPESGLPQNYRTVLDVVEQAGPGTHLTAQEIWVRARSRAPRLGFATVHRALARLHALGTVMKIGVPGEASAVYEPAASAHAHFRCSGCGDISDFDYTVPARARRELAERHGVAIEHETVTFAGRCARCVSAVR
jgi:Fe2+ or Zn2+ uptake regulation protein